MRKLGMKIAAMCSVLGSFLGLSLGNANASIPQTNTPAIAKVDADSPLFLDQAKAAISLHRTGKLTWHSSHVSHGSHGSHTSHRSSY